MLKEDFSLPVIVSELLGRTSFFLLEYPVEIGQVIESAGKADLGYGVGGVYQLPGGIAQTDINYEIGKTFSGTKLEEPAECHRGHSG